ncbi:MAG: tRNA lysidine(34) synthetase TilS [Epsilonproteobacteria bacterium]|nr:tRNA lysidine(34) synthetase TilS [Campylobacterota bacterium]
MGKNLLAFSAGVDSSALFFVLMERGIEFDIAIVNYHTRSQSDAEIQYAKELAKKYNKQIHIKDCILTHSNFEANARKCRYQFFNDLAHQYGYDHLYIAHQLNDKLEWFLMQLTKGAGLKELIAMPKTESNKLFTIHRPLIEWSKEEILEYLHAHNIKYFVDDSNFDTKYKRNFFRHEFADELIRLFKSGIKRSFEYLQEDKELLFTKDWKCHRQLCHFTKQHPQIDIKKVDLILKQMGYLLTKAQRDEIIKTDFNTVIGGKFAIDSNQTQIFIAPYIKVVMDKNFKERMRIAKIPAKIRGYIYENNINLL